MSIKINEKITVLELKNEMGTIYPTIIRDQANEKIIIVDTGLPMQTSTLEAELLLNDIGLENINTIIFTHQDIDHIGCTTDILKKSPKCITYAHIDEAPYIQGDKTPIKLKELKANEANLDEAMKKRLGFLEMGFANNRTNIDNKIDDNFKLNGIEFIHTPGHTPGHVCLYIKDAKVLIVGDCINVENGKLVGPNPIYTLDYPLAIESVKKLAKYDVETIVSYHGGILKNGNKAIADFILTSN